MPDVAAVSKHVSTSDGVELHYLEAGSGPTLVLVHGWSQSAEQYVHQINAFSDRYHVIALDLRGHGESAKPDHGYKIQRLATDLHDVLIALDLHDVALLGHSMGCSVIWCYWDLFGADRLVKLILVDEPPFLTSNPAWTQAEADAAGAIFTPTSVTETMNALVSADSDAVTRGFIGGMLTNVCPADVKEWIIQRNFRMARPHAAALLYNHCHQDWRDVIPRITLPTLVVGGRISLVPWKSVEWTAQQIPGARLEIFEEDEGGQHFMFVENAEKFNRILAEFLG